MSRRDGPRGRGGRGRGSFRGSFTGFRPGPGGGYDGSGSSGDPPMGPLFSTGPISAPDARVAQLEDKMLKNEKMGSLSLDQNYPIRPSYGTRGTPIVLWANYVQISPPEGLSLFRYDIQATPTVSGKKLNQVIRLLLEADVLADLREDLVTDFKSTLISRRKLPQDDMTIDIVYRSEGEDEPAERAPRYRVRVAYTNSLSVNDLTEYLTSTNLSAQYHDKAQMIQAFNILLNHYAKQSGHLTAIGSKVFSIAPNSAKYDLGHGLEAIRGFFASVRAATGRLLVNVNISQGAFYKSGRLDQLIDSFMERGNKFKLAGFLERLRVQTVHLKERRNKRGNIILRIKQIKRLATPGDGAGLPHHPEVAMYGAGPKQVKFWMESQGSAGAKGKGKAKKTKPGEPSPASSSGEMISVFDFFNKAYGIRLTRPDLPVINVGSREFPTYLPPEVCVVVAGQPCKKKLDSSQTQNMIRFAVRKPADNARSIVGQGLNMVGLSSDTNPLLAHFSIAASSALITVPGRILPAPKVMYRRAPVEVRFGGWNMNKVKFNKPGTVKKWSYLLISMPNYRDAFNQQSLTQTIRALGMALIAAGLDIAPPLPGQRLELSHTDDPALEAKIKAAADKMDLLFIVLPNESMNVYKRIKSLGDVKYGIHTICTVGHKLAKERGQDQYMKNVGLKMNLKLGGHNQLVEESRLGIVREDKTMVVGIDVTHPSPGSASNAPSIAGMVASIDKSLNQWPGDLRVQSGARQEMVTDLEDMLRSRLRLWKTKGHHAQYPENILVYRDGVSEGQYSKVLNEELPLLRKACETLYSAAEQKKGLPHFTIIVVGKRHHTRFYPTTEADMERSTNAKPGTVVDRGITESRNWDFFLQAHSALQGTARPAHYFVVIDEIFRQRYGKAVPPPFQNVADIIEDLTQAMCYTFGRATKVVSICTPAYYADILCERARCYLSSVFDTPEPSVEPSLASGGQGGLMPTNADVTIHNKLKDTMFYI